MNLPLVVLTYPGHFLLTALTIKSYLQYHPPVPVTVVIDDISPYAWTSYIKDCQDLYSANIIKLSQVPKTHEFNKGWIRQQIAKLHLDQLIETDSWFFTDGDIIFLNSIDPFCTPYSVPTFSEITQQQNNYVKQLLGLDHSGIFVNNQQVCVSDPPFRTMHRSILQQLRKYVGTQLLTTGEGMSEWELIENFRQHVLGEELKLVRYAPHCITNNDKKLTFDHQFLTHYGTDYDLGREWIEQQGVTTTDNIWNRLTEIHR